MLLGAWLTFEKLVLGEAIGGRPLLMLAVLLIVVGTQFFGLGLLGEYQSYGSNEPHPDRPIPLRETAGLGTRPELIQKTPTPGSTS